MKEHHVAREMAAPAEIVYNTVSDLERLQRWLPSGVTAETVEDEVVLIRWRLDGRRGEARCPIFKNTDRLRVEWRAQGTAGAAGCLEVSQAGTGSAHVEACLALPNNAPEIVDTLLENALTNLQREVGENFTVG